MEDLLLAIAGVILEACGDVLLELIVALLSRGTRKLSAFPVPNSLVTGIVLAALGSAAGFASALVFPHRLVHTTRFHGWSLVVSPLLAGLAMSQMGAAARRSGREPEAIESFTYGFIFALAVAIFRFVLVK